MPETIAGIPALTVLEKDGLGLVTRGEIQNFLALDTTASTYQLGCKITDISTGLQYVNTGTIAAPVWALLDSQVVSTNLTAAQIIAMYTTPVQVVAAVLGKAIIVDSVEFILTGTATQFTGGGVVGVQYKNTANGAGQLTHASIAASVVQNATAKIYCKRIPIDLSAIATANINGAGLFISNATAVFAAGTGTAVVVVRYHLVD